MPQEHSGRGVKGSACSNGISPRGLELPPHVGASPRNRRLRQLAPLKLEGAQDVPPHRFKPHRCRFWHQQTSQAAEEKKGRPAEPMGAGPRGRAPWRTSLEAPKEIEAQSKMLGR